MEKIRTIIVDDESLARRGLALRLEKFKDIEIIGQCKNGREALEIIELESPDLVFLDIQMPGIDGFEVVHKIQADCMPLIVFVTAFDQYAIDAFEIHAVDYVLKPVEDERLATAIERVRDHLLQSDSANQKKRLIDLITNITGETPAKIDEMLASGELPNDNYPEKIAIKDRGETTLVPAKEIGWIEAAGDYMCIHANDQVHVLRSTMKELEKKLNPNNFQRIHRSTIVNLDKIEKVCSHINGEYFLILSNNSRLKMSRSYRDKIKHII
ncbi:LytR/AlgR family response regulator transcription factor [Aliikangiella coralliicola]|uniref:Response regulator transcription factor n=1 Tax=Aliikangiella coralliicola TaxID=2592383 RepID=A0A545TS08_9GAMM|nr:LytTR family DNA-binding domain-containing protein [Aliikangiella coralliicola]TQV80008.1 response regulator transcription factor [Aliikangiella coralliicola]